jgi:cytochrome c oxidase assembly protein subunit 15
MRETGNVGEATSVRELPAVRAGHAIAPDARRLAVAFGALVVLVVGLMVLGALVRAHGAGLACPDWPLCFGQLVPSMDLRVAFEWSHRLVAGGVALVFGALALLTLRRTSTAPAVRRLIVAATLILALQILLGALTVWHLLASWTVTAHLVSGSAFAASVLLVARGLADESRGVISVPPVPTAARVWISAAAALLVIQMVLGGLVSSRYAGLACPDWPTCSGGAWFPSWQGAVGLHLLHRSVGYALAVTLAGAAVVCRRAPSLSGLTILAAILVVLQVIVGVVNVRFVIPVEVTGLHTGLAALLVLTLTLCVQTAWRRGARPS